MDLSPTPASRTTTKSRRAGHVVGESRNGAGGELVRVKLLIAYDGAPFRGFAINEGVETVAGRLTEALEIIVQGPVTLTCAGRTDAGVHAWGQVVTFDADSSRVVPDMLRSSVNSMCGPEIVCREAIVVESDFDARYHATGRSYRYTILNRQVPDPFLYDRAWLLTMPLDIDAMNKGGQHLLGLHDFSSFCRRQMVISPEGEDVEAPRLRRLRQVTWSRHENDVVRLDIEANSFCNQMVRSITGCLVGVGLGELSPQDVPGILALQDRNEAGRVAPPHGLTLWNVNYDGKRVHMPGARQGDVTEST